MEQITFSQGLFNLFLWGGILLVLWPASSPPYSLKPASRFIGICLILLFCIYPFWGGDYFHTIESFNSVKQGGYSNFEAFYNWVILQIAPTYTIFRFIVWGGALFLLLGAYKRIGQSFDLSLFFFGVLFLPIFSYARASLAMSSIILGITFIFKPIRQFKLISTGIGLALVVCSVFFHRSAVVGIVSVLLSVLLIENKKWKMILVLIFLPVGVYFFSNILNSFMTFDFDVVDEFVNQRRDFYFSREDTAKGISTIIYNFLLRTPMFLSALLYFLLVTKGHYNALSTVERAIASYVFIIMLLSFVFSLNLGYNTDVLYYRTINYAMPANAIFLMSIRSRFYDKGLFRIIFWMALTASLYALMYATYMGYNRM